MFGVEIDGPCNVFCDNQGMVKNSSIPESTLMKKHNAVNYHVVREAAVAGMLHVGKEDGLTNLADLLAKILTGQRWDLCWNLMWQTGSLGQWHCVKGSPYSQVPFVRHLPRLA